AIILFDGMTACVREIHRGHIANLPADPDRFICLAHVVPPRQLTDVRGVRQALFIPRVVRGECPPVCRMHLTDMVVLQFSSSLQGDILMTKSRNHRVFWSSGEKCETAGTYFSMCCGVHLEFNFVPGDTFIRCP